MLHKWFSGSFSVFFTTILSLSTYPQQRPVKHILGLFVSLSSDINQIVYNTLSIDSLTKHLESEGLPLHFFRELPVFIICISLSFLTQNLFCALIPQSSSLDICLVLEKSVFVLSWVRGKDKRQVTSKFLRDWLGFGRLGVRRYGCEPRLFCQ